MKSRNWRRYLKLSGDEYKWWNVGQTPKQVAHHNSCKNSEWIVFKWLSGRMLHILHHHRSTYYYSMLLLYVTIFQHSLIWSFCSRSSCIVWGEDTIRFIFRSTGRVWRTLIWEAFWERLLLQQVSSWVTASQGMNSWLLRNEQMRGLIGIFGYSLRTFLPKYL